MASDVLLPPRDAIASRTGDAWAVPALTGHALLAFARRPVSAFFTLVLPLSFFVIVNAIAGDQTATEDGTVRVSQYLVAPFAVFGAVEAVFCVLAIDLALLRENGVLKRLRSSPTPTWAVLTARVGAAVIVAVSSVLVLLAVGLVAYDVELIWRKLPAAALTLVVGVACFAALGLALVGLTRSAVAAQALSNGLIIPLMFISNVFMIDADLPSPLAWLGRVLPLRHFADALATTFDPLTPGVGFRPGDLAVMAAWGVAGGLVARWRFGWEPRRGERAHASTRVAPAAAASRDRAALTVRHVGRVGPVRAVATQVRAALIAMRRDMVSAFFGVVFPILLLLLFPAVFPDALMQGLPVGVFMVPGMIAYAIAVTAYVHTPEAVAQAREHGVLERLRGSPARVWTFYAGRAVTTVLVTAVTAALLVGVSVVTAGLQPDLARMHAALLAYAAGVVCFSVLGFALVEALRGSQRAAAVALGTLLPLSFISDVFFIGTGELPRTLRIVADVFPLKHLSHALLTALRPDGGGSGIAWANLGVLALWTLAGVAVMMWLRGRDRR